MDLFLQKYGSQDRLILIINHKPSHNLIFCPEIQHKLIEFYIQKYSSHFFEKKKKIECHLYSQCSSIPQ